MHVSAPYPEGNITTQTVKPKGRNKEFSRLSTDYKRGESSAHPLSKGEYAANGPQKSYPRNFETKTKKDEIKVKSKNPHRRTYGGKDLVKRKYSDKAGTLTR